MPNPSEPMGSLASFFAADPLLEIVFSEHEKDAPGILTFASLASRRYRDTLIRDISTSLATIAQEKPLVLELEHLPAIAVSELATGSSVRLNMLRKSGRAALRGQEHAMVCAGLIIEPWAKLTERRLIGVSALLTIKDATGPISEPSSTIRPIGAGALSSLGRPQVLGRLERPTTKEVSTIVRRFVEAPRLMQSELVVLPATKAARRADSQTVMYNRLYRYMALALTPISKAIFATGMCDTIAKRALTEPTAEARSAAKQHNAISREQLVHHFWRIARSSDGFEPPLVV